MKLFFCRLLFIFAGMYASSVGAADKTPVKFVMDWAFEGPEAIWTVAAQSGCFDDSNLNVKIDRSFGSNDAISKVASGAYDIGVADFSALVGYDAGHSDDPIVATLIISERAATSIVVLKKTGITKPQDLVGKRVADGMGEASRVLFPAFAKANGIDPDSVTWVSVAPNLRQPIVIKGEADAAAGHLFTIAAGLHALGVGDEEMTVMPYADWGAATFGNSIIAKSSWVAAHPDAMRAFIKCAVLGVKRSIADPAAAVETLKKYNPLGDDKLDQEALGFSNSKAILTDNVKANGLSTFAPDQVDAMIAKIATAMGVTKPALSTVWTPAYLPPAASLVIQ
jgi:NitT/TauT family transport system substrate-binding protein